MARAAEACVITCNVVVDLPVQQCWDLYIDNQLMPEWAPSISHIECESPTLNIDVSRKCIVTLEGKSGYTVELCTRFDQLKQIDVSVISETFGFSHMLVHYGFNTLFNAEGSNTLLSLETHYQPKKIFASVMTSPSTQQLLLDLITANLQSFKQFAQR